MAHAASDGHEFNSTRQMTWTTLRGTPRLTLKLHPNARDEPLKYLGFIETTTTSSCAPGLSPSLDLCRRHLNDKRQEYLHRSSLNLVLVNPPKHLVPTVQDF